MSLETGWLFEERVRVFQRELFNNLQQLYDMIFLLLFRTKIIIPTSSRDLTTLIESIKMPGYSKWVGLFGLI